VKFNSDSAFDRGSCRDDFKRDGFVHIPAVLHPNEAGDIHKVLTEATPWNLCFNDRQKHIDIAPENLASMTAAQHDRLLEAVYAPARTAFQYFYNNYPIFDAYKAGLNQGHLLHVFYEWLNSEEFLSLMRHVTGFEDISFADAQATRFTAGHFLKRHDDNQINKNRRAAFVFNFTDEWEADWGGYLQLLDNKGHIRRGIKPVFNSLNILAVPQMHNVSFVTPFAGGARFAITGWLRYGASV
jgi:SM-20-related protein